MAKYTIIKKFSYKRPTWEDCPDLIYRNLKRVNAFHLNRRRIWEKRGRHFYGHTAPKVPTHWIFRTPSFKGWEQDGFTVPHSGVFLP